MERHRFKTLNSVAAAYLLRKNKKHLRSRRLVQIPVKVGNSWAQFVMIENSLVTRPLIGSPASRKSLAFLIKLAVSPDGEGRRNQHLWFPQQIGLCVTKPYFPWVPS